MVLQPEIRGCLHVRKKDEDLSLRTLRALRKTRKMAMNELLALSASTLVIVLAFPTLLSS
jgi:hypothetical protein